jgi:hypothetical protein
MKKIVPNTGWTIDKIAASALFDVDFYEAKYPDVKLAKVDPFEHYSSHGWHEGRDPSERFSTNFYLRSNPDVAAAKVNPLYHYAISGAKEGRAALPPRHSIDSGKDIVLGALPARVRAVGWTSEKDIDAPLARADIQLLLTVEFEKSTESALISLSHDQYTKSVGGVQSAIAIEQAILSEAGWTYIHLCPASPLPFLADGAAEDATFLVLTLGGRRRGVVRLSDFLAAVSTIAQEKNKALRLVVHHLMGFSVETVLRLSNICKAGTPMVWVHDFFSLCTNPFLLRNDIAFCNAPTVDSSACLVCCEGLSRGPHLAAIERLFNELHPIVLAPSETALNFWKTKGEFPYASAFVLPLAKVHLGVEAARSGSGPLRVAHLGAAAPHKGWSTFKKIVERHAEDDRYKFFRLGFGSAPLKGLTEVLVEVGPKNVDAMIDAIREYEIDVVINWSSCFETFSFITIEALAAGAFIIARRDAGNVWPAVLQADRARGMSVATEVELRALFLSGDIARQAAGPLTRGHLERSRGTADLLLKEASFV